MSLQLHSLRRATRNGHFFCFGSPFTFTGEPMDANDLLYLRARYYHPALGVFTGLDPVENHNRYQYVGGNVINVVDPSGMIAKSPGEWDRCFSRQVAVCTCGPDVTQWFMEEIFYHIVWSKATLGDSSGWPEGIGTFVPYGANIPYKWIDFNDQDIGQNCPSGLTDLN